VSDDELRPPPIRPPNWIPGLESPDPEDIVSCVSCGLCLPHCPTYRLTGRESASPRGRIAAMRAVQEGQAVIDDTFRTMMDECLACRACETACPSGVPFGRMIEAARAQVEPTRPLPQRMLRSFGLTKVLPRPWAIFTAGALLGIGQTLRLDRLAPAATRATTPRVVLTQLARPLPRELGTGPTAALLCGCVMDVAFRDVQRDTMRDVAEAGFRAVRPRAGGCCGALAMHYGHPDAARQMARARIAEFEDADVVVVNSAGCSNHMKTWGHLLADDPVWGPRAAAVAARVRDLLELDLVPRRRDLGAVACHDACHHINGQSLGGGLRRLVAAAGGTPVEVPDGARCCGAAGLYSVLQPEMSTQLRRQKAEAITTTGASTVAVANPGCAIQIAAGLREIASPIRVVHPASLIRPTRTARRSRR
jgi:glycolate oxidase iron-sulfur subunit